MSGLTEHEREDWQRAVPAGSFPRTDAGNGEYFAKLHGDLVRYDHRRGKWMLWRRHWWADDAMAHVRILAKEAARERYRTALRIGDLEERGRESRFAINTENRARIEAMLLSAKSEPPIADTGDAWDLDGWLLGAANGVVDLRTGSLRPGTQDDRITLHTDIAYDADATCPRWDRYLAEVFMADDELIDYVWKAIGYSLTGDVSEQCFFTCHGSGSNGKSVFLEVLRAVGGMYAANTPFTTFELRDRSSIPNDIAALAGRRIVTAAETSEGTRLNEARIKVLTGGDVTTARFLNQEFFTFRPVGKIWLAVNHPPVVRDHSRAFWRRVRLIPFLRTFEDAEAERTLIDELYDELPGILAWAVKGVAAWQRYGLRPPGAVTSATETYRVESDPFADFIAGCCVVGPKLVVRASEAYSAYRRWAGDRSLTERETLTSTQFGTKLGERYGKDRDNRGAFYEGIGLRADVGPAGQSDGSGDGS